MRPPTPASRSSPTARGQATSASTDPDPVDASNDLHANATFRANAFAAGLPANFFVMNPDVDQANITRDAATTKYDAFQIDFRRRLSRGLTASINYTYAKTYETDLDTLRRDRAVVLAGDGVPHALKTTWYYEVPVGRGQRFGGNINPWLNGLIGNWEFSGTGRLQVRDFRIDDASRLVGMTESELARAFKVEKVRDASGSIVVWSLPRRNGVSDHERIYRHQCDVGPRWAHWADCVEAELVKRGGSRL